MNIIIAPNAFKGTLSADQICHILSHELSSLPFHIISLPMCDGGDGTAAIIAQYCNAVPHHSIAPDALGRPHSVTFYSYGHTAIVDLAEVCGLKTILPYEYDITQANTEGLGHLLLEIAQQDYKKILLGIGGSASVDGGLGALQAMGMKIKKSGNNFRNHLIEIESFDFEELKKNFQDIEWNILCDVDNPLLGPQGASFVFAPQKGADRKQVDLLEEKMNKFAAMLGQYSSCSINTIRHGGAAGGIAASFHVLLNAKLLSGSEYCLKISKFKELSQNAAMVIIGEGKLDSQSLNGKIPGYIAQYCQQCNIPIIAICGSVEEPINNFYATYQLIDFSSCFQDSIQNADKQMIKVAKRLKLDLLSLL